MIFFLFRQVCVVLCIDIRPGSTVYSYMCWCCSADRRVEEVAKKCTWACEIHVCIEHLFTIAHASLHSTGRESKSCMRVLCRNNRIFDDIFETCMTIKCKHMLVFLLLLCRRRFPLLLYQWQIPFFYSANDLALYHFVVCAILCFLFE